MGGLMKKHEYITSFSSMVKPLVSEQKDEILAIASLNEIGEFLPEIDTDKNKTELKTAKNYNDETLWTQDL